MMCLIEGEPYECPMAPFGGVEQLAWSPDSKTIAYTCRKKTGVDYATSTDSDIFLYDVATGSTKNLCKPEGYKAPEVDYTTSLKHQAVNNQADDVNVGYDTNPQFSPDGKYVAWQSMKHDGYESDPTDSASTTSPPARRSMWPRSSTPTSTPSAGLPTPRRSTSLVAGMLA